MRVHFSLISAFLLLAGCAGTGATPEKMRIATLTPPPQPGLMASVSPAAPQSPPIMKMGDRYWVVTHPFRYQVLNSAAGITIPKGFVTDLASIPMPLWSFGLDPTDSYLAAAIIHDYLYWDQRCGKDEADSVLKLAMIETEVPGVKRWIVYEGVNLFGQASFARNAQLKNRKETRFFTASYTDTLMASPMARSSTMQRLIEDAREKGETLDQDDSNPDVKGFCKAGVTALAKL